MCILFWGFSKHDLSIVVKRALGRVYGWKIDDGMAGWRGYTVQSFITFALREV
jgi:hypothetical protein